MAPISVPDTPFVQTLEHVRHDGGRRWRSADGKRFYEWDELHGEFEVYNKRGRHLGVVDQDGVATKDAVPGRSIDV
ncbi:MAG: colicin E3/pyocin S6 family cytotoxin [Polyangiaceae bacterium]|jgi:hypothetical protein